MEVAAAAGRWLGSGTLRLADETLQRFLIWCGVDLRLPVQFHVGYGDSDVDLHRCNPLLLTPLLVVAFGMVPGGWIFASANLAFKASKLSHITGLARMFSLQNLTELLKSLLKMAVLLGVAWYLLLDALPQLIALQRSDIRSAIGGALGLLFDTLIGLLAVFVFFALLDIPLQRFLFRKRMRMTKQERREEHKTQEGRPEVKARIRQVQRQLLQRLPQCAGLRPLFRHSR